MPEVPSSHARGLARIPALDGVRGFAALSVLAWHTFGLPLNGGVGVEIFFVLSGFLIGGVVLDTVGTPGWVQRFYIRRTLRIWPLYYAVVAILVITDHLVAEPINAPQWMLWTFLGNAVHTYPNAHRLAALVLWSLAVEEHFYLLLPLLAAKMKREQLPMAILLVALSSIGLRLVLGRLMSGWFIYSFTLTRLDSLCFGVLAAWVHRERRSWLPAFRYLALAGVVLKIVAFPRDSWVIASTSAVLLTTLESLATAAILLALVNDQVPTLARLFSNRWLVWAGSISYGLYMLHPLVMEALVAIRPVPQGWTLMLLTLPLTLVVATLSWRYFEQPLLAMSARSGKARLASTG